MNRLPLQQLRLPDIYSGRDQIFSLLSPGKKEKKRNSKDGSDDSSSTDEEMQDQYYSDDDSNDSSLIQHSDDGEKQEGEESLRSVSNVRSPRARGWRILQKHLKKGTLLLNANGEYDSHRSQKSVRQAMVNEFQEGMNFSVRFCLLSILAYLVLAVVMYSNVFQPNWTVIDSCYFAVTTFTTLGYGDLAPTNTASLIFTCAYAFFGVAFLGVTLGVLGNRIIEKHDVLVEEVEIENRDEVMAMFGTSPEERVRNSSARSWLSTNTTGTSTASSSSDQSVLHQAGETLCGGGSWNWQRFVWMSVAVAMLVVIIAYQSHWDFVSTVYYVIITSCTIGYGDLVPSTQFERLVAVIYIPLVCLIMGHWLGYVANTIIEMQSSKFRKKSLEHRELTQDDLDAMDANGNGKVSWAEFLEFMLVAMEKVDYELVDELQTYFRQLDVANTGELSRKDLLEAARRKLKFARRKLELATYKRKVINLGKFGVSRRDGKHKRNQTFADMFEKTLRNLSVFDLLPQNDNDGKDWRGAGQTHSFHRGDSSPTYKDRHLNFLTTRPSQSKSHHARHLSYGSVRNVRFSPDVDSVSGPSRRRSDGSSSPQTKGTKWEPLKDHDERPSTAKSSDDSPEIESYKHRKARRAQAAMEARRPYETQNKDTPNERTPLRLPSTIEELQHDTNERTNEDQKNSQHDNKETTNSSASAIGSYQERRARRLENLKNKNQDTHSESFPADVADGTPGMKNRHSRKHHKCLSPQLGHRAVKAVESVAGEAAHRVKRASGTIADATKPAFKGKEKSPRSQHGVELSRGKEESSSLSFASSSRTNNGDEHSSGSGRRKRHPDEEELPDV